MIKQYKLAYKFPMQIIFDNEAASLIDNLWKLFYQSKPPIKLYEQQSKKINYENCYLKQVKTLFKLIPQKYKQLKQFARMVNTELYSLQVVPYKSTLSQLKVSFPGFIKYTKQAKQAESKFVYFKNALNFIEQNDKSKWSQFESKMKFQKLLDQKDKEMLIKLANQKYNKQEIKNIKLQLQQQLHVSNTVLSVLQSFRINRFSKKQQDQISKIKNKQKRQKLKLFIEYLQNHCISLLRSQQNFMKLLSALGYTHKTQSEISQLLNKLPKTQHTIVSPIVNNIFNLRKNIKQKQDKQSRNPTYDRLKISELQKQIARLKEQLNSTRQMSDNYRQNAKLLESQMERLKQKSNLIKRQQTYKNQMNTAKIKGLNTNSNKQLMNNEFQQLKQKYKKMIEQNESLKNLLKSQKQSKSNKIIKSQQDQPNIYYKKLLIFKQQLKFISKMKAIEWQRQQKYIKTNSLLTKDQIQIIINIGQYKNFYDGMSETDLENILKSNQNYKILQQQNKRLRQNIIELQELKRQKQSPMKNPLMNKKNSKNEKEMMLQNNKQNKIDSPLRKNEMEYLQLKQEYQKLVGEYKKQSDYIKYMQNNNKQVKNINSKQKLNKVITYQKQYNELKQINTRLQTEISQKNKQIDRIKYELNKLNKQLKQLNSNSINNKQLLKYKNDYININQQLKQQKQNYKQLKLQYIKLQNILNSQQNIEINKLRLNQKIIKNNYNLLQKQNNLNKNNISKLIQQINYQKLNQIQSTKIKSQYNLLKQSYKILEQNYQRLIIRCNKQNQLIHDLKTSSSSTSINSQSNQINDIKQLINIKQNIIKSLKQEHFKILSAKDYQISQLQIQISKDNIQFTKDNKSFNNRQLSPRYK